MTRCFQLFSQLMSMFKTRFVETIKRKRVWNIYSILGGNVCRVIVLISSSSSHTSYLSFFLRPGYCYKNCLTTKQFIAIFYEFSFGHGNFWDCVVGILDGHLHHHYRHIIIVIIIVIIMIWNIYQILDRIVSIELL